MLNNKSFQTIFDELSIFLPKGWEKMIAYFEYGEASYTFAFYVKNKNDYIKCFDIPGVSDSELLAAFRKIDLVLSDERTKDKNSLWSNMTMIIDADGNMHSDFDYTDLSTNAYAYSKEWKSKYLK